MDVTEVLDTWKEMRQRDRQILPLDEAINVVQSSHKHILMKLKEQTSKMNQAQSISANELNNKINTSHNLVLLDVREHNERPVNGVLSHNEVHIPLNSLEPQAYSKIPDREANVVVYCSKGIRGVTAANSLKQMGYQNVTNLKGGMQAWKEAGLKTIMPR